MNTRWMEWYIDSPNLELVVVFILIFKESQKFLKIVQIMVQKAVSLFE